MRICSILVVAGATACVWGRTESRKAPARVPPDSVLHSTIVQFYGWALESREWLDTLEPRTKTVSGSSRLVLDTSTLKTYSEAFIRSGLFSVRFKGVLSGYFGRWRKELDGRPQAWFDTLAWDGGAPILESDDIDVYFCTQEEYELKPEYFERTKLDSVAFSGNDARAVAVSPSGLRTPFWFSKERGVWKIRAYCIFR